MLIVGLFLRMIDHQLKEGHNKRLIEVKNEVKERLIELNNVVEREVNYQRIPIRKLVTVQLGAGLYTMLYVKEGAGR